MFLLFDDLGFPELIVIGVAGVLVFGKRLPEVASQAGAQLAKFRRALQDVKHDTNVDHEVRQLRRTIEEAVPRDFSVGAVAKLAQRKVEERLESARGEVEGALGPPPEVLPPGSSPTGSLPRETPTLPEPTPPAGTTTPEPPPSETPPAREPS